MWFFRGYADDIVRCKALADLVSICLPCDACFLMIQRDKSNPLSF